MMMWHYNIKIQRYQPYIFTDFELRCLFDEIDDVKPCARSHAELILPVFTLFIHPAHKRSCSKAVPKIIGTGHIFAV